MDAHWQRRLVQFVLLPLLFFVGVKLSLAFAVMPDVLVMLWLPNSLVLAGLLHYGWRGYAGFAAAILLAEVAADYPTFTALEATLFGIINLIEGTLAFLLLRRWRFNPRFALPSDIAKFLVAGPVLAALVSACLAAAVYKHARGAETAYAELVRVWWFSDATGLVILTPLVLSLWPISRGAREHLPLRWFDGAVAAAALVVLAAFLLADKAVFRDIQVRPVLLFPFVVYAATRLTPQAATVVVAFFATAMLYVTKSGQQPFGAMPVSETVLQVQQFVFFMTITAMALSALLSQQRAHARELESRVQERTVELRRANERLEALTITDALTGLHNRRALYRILQQELERSLRHGHPLAVVMFDLDRFKQVNDRHGHVAGDAVLRHVAGVAARAVRTTDALARYGGEEFVVLAPETDAKHALQLAERVREAVAGSPTPFEQQQIAITASFGVATLHPGDAEPDTLIARADAALYRAKAAGRNCVVLDESPAVQA